MQSLINKVIHELQNGNYLEVIRYCNQLVIKFPDNYILYDIRGNCYFELGEYQKAIENFTDAISRVPAGDTAKLKEIASLYNRRGFSYIKKNENDNAINDLKKSIEMIPDYPEALNNLGIAYRKTGKFEDAILFCSRAIELKPGSPEFYNNRGNCYYLNSKSNEAISDYTKAIILNSNYAGAYYNRGTAFYYLTKDYRAALTDWEKAIELNQSYAKELKEKISEINNKLAPLELPLTETKEPEVETKEPEIEKTSDFDDLRSLLGEDEKESDITIPDFDFKSMFQEKENDDFDLTEEQDEPALPEKILPEEVKRLHDEIESEKKKEEIKPPLPPAPVAKERKSFFKSIWFYVILIIILGSAGLFIITKIIFEEKPDIKKDTLSLTQQTKPQELTDTTKVQIEKADSVKEETTSKTEPEEKPVQVETKKEQNTTIKVLELEGRKDLLLTKEGDKYFIQVASYKDKQIADRKTSLLEKIGIKANTVEANLESKGIYYRVKVGPLNSMEEVKNVAGKIK